MSQTNQTDRCEECGLGVAGGSAGCRKLFEEVLAKEFGDFRYGRLHRLTVDTYGLQHPEKYMLSAKSFAAHLTGMFAAMEQAEDPGRVLEINRVVQKWLSTNPELTKPDHIPADRGDLKITHVHTAADAAEHLARVREWAATTWLAWSDLHELARKLIETAFKR